MISIFNQQIPKDINDINGEDLIPLVGAGIVNPFGPTLTLLAIIGDIDLEGPFPLIYLMLNPFTQKAEIVGEVLIEIQIFSPSGLQPLLDFPFGSCPTLLFPSGYTCKDENIVVFSKFLRRFSEARNVFDSVKKYPGDPWGRIKEDIQKLPRYIADHINGQNTEKCEQLSEEESIEFATILLSEEHASQEIAAFIAAWTGAIERQAKNSGGIILPAMDMEKFKSIVPAYPILKA